MLYNSPQNLLILWLEVCALWPTYPNFHHLLVSISLETTILLYFMNSAVQMPHIGDTIQ